MLLPMTAVLPANTSNQLVPLIKGVPKFVEKAIEKSVEWKKEHDGPQDDFSVSAQSDSVEPNHLDELPF